MSKMILFTNKIVDIIASTFAYACQYAVDSRYLDIACFE